MIPFIETGSSLIFTWTDGTPRQVAKDHKNFKEIDELIKNIGTFEELLELQGRIEELLNPVVLLHRIAGDENSELSISDQLGLSFKINEKDVEIPSALGSSIMAIYKEGGNLQPMVNFLTKMASNPDPEVASQIWGFIESCGLCLTLDGNFLAYKNVNEDFSSVYDCNVDNSPGTILSMPRSAVEKNPDRTCASGLHFAAWGYLRHYAFGRKTVLVSVSPADVVSIPTDYNNQKGRACKYKIVREVAQPEELKDTALFTESDADFD